jgi:hypothetical protein
MDNIINDSYCDSEPLIEALFNSDNIVPGMGSEIWMLLKANNK